MFIMQCARCDLGKKLSMFVGLVLGSLVLNPATKICSFSDFYVFILDSHKNSNRLNSETLL